MDFNNLVCRCGCKNDWDIEWSTYGSEWVLSICCGHCGAIHNIAHAKEYHSKVIDLKAGYNLK